MKTPVKNKQMMKTIEKHNWTLAACFLLLLLSLPALGLMNAVNKWQKPLLAASADNLPVTDSFSSLPGSVAAPTAPTPPLTNSELKTAYGKLPLSFEQNQGQTDSKVDFIARGAGYSLFLEPTEAVFVLPGQSDQPSRNAAADASRPRNRKQQRNSSAAGQRAVLLRMKLVGANPKARTAGAEEQSGKVSYFVGSDKSKWQSGISTFGRVNYKDVYPGINATYYGNQQQLEYDFQIQPWADYKQIKLHFEGAKRVEIERGSGDLLLYTKAGVIREHSPKVYQEVAGNKQEIAGRYIKRGKGIGFEIGKYDRTLPLVIDPTLSYSTYLGGSSSDPAFSIAVDSMGNAYLTGTTYSTNFPTLNPIQSTYGGNIDAFVAKFNASGTALVYSTYLGGNLDDYGYSIAVDSSNNAYVSGLTRSTDFPTLNPVQGTSGGAPYDAFVTKINASGGLVYSTYLGGSGDDRSFAIAVDSTGNAYVAGFTSSTNFPTLNPVQPMLGGGNDTFVAKINSSGTALVYSTYLGGSADDQGYGIVVDSSGNASLIGQTESTNFPTLNAIQPALGGSVDAFVTKFNASGTAFLYSTYLGGSDRDYGYGIAIDLPGNTYLTGYTASTNFPTFNPFQGTSGGGYDAFAAKINTSGGLVYSTYLGGSNIEVGNGIAVDSIGNAYLTGFTASTNFPTVNPLQSTFQGSIYDAFATKINPAGTALVYSTYLGGSGDDFGYDIAVDSNGNAYLTGYTTSTNFPTLNPFQPTLQGGNDTFVTKINSTLLTRARFDFDGDGKADVSLFRPSNGTWYRLNSGSGNSFSSIQFGVAEDKIAPADYDGDGKTDIAVFRPSTGVWYLLQSTSDLLIQAFGQAGDVPAPGDYDGDGKADLAVFRPSTGVWYVQGSTRGIFVLQFGVNGDIPQTGDFDGDGKADISLYRPSNGTWYRINSSNNSFSEQTFGAPGDLPDAMDFDADGKTDLAVFRPSTGVWYLQQSTNGFTAMQFGTSNDIPAAVDYDGDGKADIALFRSSSGTWYINRSSTGFYGVQFGQAGDVPIESAFGQP